MGTAPFHWDGDLPTVSRLMSEVFVSRMRGPQVDEAYVGALGTWIDKIPTLPTGAPRNATAADRGRRLFHDAKVGCASCHNGEMLTNNTTVEVGTGRQLQVPTLKGIAFRAPYMHDGCAPTLKDRFGGKCGGGDRHGVTSKLTAAELDDLVAYLETL
jgi:mono/diheme cytochrome c family protein